jgi:thiamine monophosphate kinase
VEAFLTTFEARTQQPADEASALVSNEPRDRLGRALDDARTALTDASDSELAAALRELAASASRLAATLEAD